MKELNRVSAYDSIYKKPKIQKRTPNQSSRSINKHHPSQNIQLVACFLISIAKSSTLRVQQALKRSIASKLANIDLKVKGNVLSAIVERLDRAADLVVASPGILLLP